MFDSESIIHARFIKRKDTKQLVMQYIHSHSRDYYEEHRIDIQEIQLNDIILINIPRGQRDYIIIGVKDVFKMLDIQVSNVEYCRMIFVPTEVLRAYILDCMNKKAIEMRVLYNKYDYTCLVSASVV